MTTIAKGKSMQTIAPYNPIGKLASSAWLINRESSLGAYNFIYFLHLPEDQKNGIESETREMRKRHYSNTEPDLDDLASKKRTNLPKPTCQHDQLVNSYYDIIRSVGEDTEREGLLKTPERAAKAISYLTKGYHQNLDEVVKGAIFNEDTEDMVIVKDIEFFSLCEHHMLPFYGRVSIGYLPNKKILGLSKFAR